MRSIVLHWIAFKVLLIDVFDCHDRNREDKTKEKGLFVLTETDFFEAPLVSSASDVLKGLTNADHIKEHIRNLEQKVRICQKKNSDPKKLIKNYSFVGAPGTGKTTVARAFGTLFRTMGLLSSGEVVECKAMELVGMNQGDSAKLMR